MHTLKATTAAIAALLGTVLLAGCGHGAKHAADDTPAAPLGSSAPVVPQVTAAPQVPTRPVPASFRPYSLTVVGQMRYLLGGAGNTTTLIRSTDGGRTWAAVNAPAAPLGVSTADVGNAKNTV